MTTSVFSKAGVAHSLLLVCAALIGCQKSTPISFDTPGSAEVKSLSPERLPSVDGPRVSDRFPNISLIDQHGRQLKFYDDLVRDKVVCIVFFYTRCTGTCPTTTVTLEKLRHTLAGVFPEDEVQFISLTLEPDVDTAEELQTYVSSYSLDMDESLPDWTYCTGRFAEVDRLRKALGVYDLDPEIDADKTEHASIITFGNDRLNRWAALPAGLGVSDLRKTLLRICGNDFRQRYSSAVTSAAGGEAD